MSPRPAKEKPLVLKLTDAFKAVGKLKRAGRNRTRNYNFTRATDVFEAVRHELFSRGVLTICDEERPEYVPVATSNGGEQITECRLPVKYTFKDANDALGPFVINGIGRDVEDKSLYKAQTGAQKALLKRFGLMAEETEDPEFDGQQPTETLDDVAPMRTPKKVTERQVQAFNEACVASGKTAEQISHYLAAEHKVSSIGELGRGKPFTRAIVWASDGKGTLAPPTPKPQAVVSAGQGSLPLRSAPAPIEMRLGNQSIKFEPREKDKAFSV